MEEKRKQGDINTILSDRDLGGPKAGRGLGDMFTAISHLATAATGLTPSSLALYPSNVPFDPETSRQVFKHVEETNRLRRELEEKVRELEREKVGNREKIQELQTELYQLKEKEKLSFLLTRVNQQAQAELMKARDLQKNFLEEKQCRAFVMSVDIRRSTELMLKARDPQQFAYFLTTICVELERIVKDHYGVFDKFTGDGILAFFPEFFSGEGAGFYVISAADECHRIFREKYREFR